MLHILMDKQKRLQEGKDISNYNYEQERVQIHSTKIRQLRKRSSKVDDNVKQLSFESPFYQKRKYKLPVTIKITLKNDEILNDLKFINL
jgi:hypothetical protein